MRKFQTELSIEIEDEGVEAVVRRIIDSGSPIEHVALLDGLFGPAGDAYQITAAEIADIDGDGTLIAAFEARAKTFLRAVLGEGETAGHVHHANGHTRAPVIEEQPWLLQWRRSPSLPTGVGKTIEIVGVF